MSNSSADPLTIYCAACNEAFLGRTGSGECPRCGMPISGLHDAMLNTITISRPSKSEPPLIRKGKEDDLYYLVGEVVAHYHIQSLLGRGGMGWVFLARHLQLNRTCALKILSPSLVAKDQEYLARFYSEGQAAAALNAENIVTVHAIGGFEGLHYLEMEFVPGRSLQKVIGDQQLLPIRATTIALGIADGLAAAHRVGIVHRDLKPDNVLLSHQGTPKIADFGLAKRLHSQSALMASGTLAGTPHFMAPEVLQGLEATPASDVYALGVSLFVMLTGHVPFIGKDFHSLSQAIQHEPPPNIRHIRPDIPLELAECLAMMMEKSPANRPQNGIEAASLLQAVQGQVRDLETLVFEAFDHEPQVQWKRHGEHFEVLVTMSDGRSQTVHVEVSKHEIQERLLQIYSLCCPADKEFCYSALKLNSKMSHGAIAIRNENEQDYFIALCSYPLATVDVEEIRLTVLDLAHQADAIELELTGEDRH
ncbi:protein kinase domain-containing protein [Planctomicrobium sp. SH668]|uniref:serine/threonine protein kinase n=1 Tax=Planctomicrobium sp. SH668 TaxID=3448126 RepID=UPI003F5C378E